MRDRLWYVGGMVQVISVVWMLMWVRAIHLQSHSRHWLCGEPVVMFCFVLFLLSLFLLSTSVWHGELNCGDCCSRCTWSIPRIIFGEETRHTWHTSLHREEYSPSSLDFRFCGRDYIYVSSNDYYARVSRPWYASKRRTIFWRDSRPSGRWKLRQSFLTMVPYPAQLKGEATYVQVNS